MWPVVADTLSKLTFIFASGIADDFHSNYSTTVAFLDKFELLCGSRRSVERLRGHAAYIAFNRRWSLPVYFQLRFQEIAGAAEGLFSEPLAECSIHSKPWRLTVGNAVIALIERCWTADVYLPGLTHRFWKLTLQILSRCGPRCLAGLMSLASNLHLSFGSLLSLPLPGTQVLLFSTAILLCHQRTKRSHCC